MAIPKHVTALANHKGAAIVHAGGMLIPVKIMDISHEETLQSSETAFKCLVVNPEQVSPAEIIKSAKTAANSAYGRPVYAPSDRYNPQFIMSAAEICEHIAAARPTYVKAVSPFEIDRVLFNGPATIVFWKNGGKTIVVSRNNEAYDMETDLALCFTLRRLGIAKVIFDNPTTTVTWEDGAETVVKCQEGDTWSKETGLFTCIAKKALGNKGNFNEVFKKHMPSY